MKFNRLILISIFLLAIISLGAASAVDDLNTEIGEGQNTDDIQATPVSEDIAQDTNTDDDTSALSADGEDVQTASQTYVINNQTVSTYFGSDGKLVDTVEEGSTLDFQGKITSDNIKTIVINKKVNIVSSTKNGEIYLNTSSGAEITTGDLKNRFILDANASGTVLSGITFYNTQLLLLDNIHDVTIDGISVIAENISMKTPTLASSWDSSVGIVSILASENMTIKNSKFYANNVSATLFRANPANRNYEIFNNSFTLFATGSSNVIYMYRANNDQLDTIRIYNNNFYGDKESLSVQVPVKSLFENNNGNVSLSLSGYSTVKNCTFYRVNPSGLDNIIVSSNFDLLSVYSNQLSVDNCNITTFELGGDNSLINNSNISTLNTVGGRGGHLITNCVIGSVRLSNVNGNIFINKNTINGVLSIPNRYLVAEITNNTIYGYIDATQRNIKEGTIIEGNTIYSTKDYAIDCLSPNVVIINNYLFAKKSWGDNSVSGVAKTIANNVPTQIDLNVSADNIVYYNKNKIVVYIPYVSGNISLFVNSIEILVPIVDGYANYTINESFYHIGENTVEAFYADAINEIYAFNSTKFTVDKISNYTFDIISENATDGIKTTIDLVLTNDAYGLALITIDNGDYKLTFNRNLTVGDNVIDIPGLLEDTYNITVDFSSDIYASRILNSIIVFNKAVNPVPEPNTVTVIVDGVKYDGEIVNGTVTIKTKAPAPAKQVPTLKAAKKTVTIKKSAKSLVLSATLKINGKAKKSLKVIFIFNGKKYTGVTNAKGVAKVTIKKNIIKKLKAGKNYTVKITYAKKTAKTVVKVKK